MPDALPPILFHPHFKDYGLAPDGTPYSRRHRRVPRPIKPDGHGGHAPRLHLRHDGRTLKVPLALFAAQCRGKGSA